MAIESLLSADMLMNLSILICVQLGLGRMHLPSLAKALSLLCADTAIGYLFHPRWWNSFVVQGCICTLCGMLISNSRRPGQIFLSAAAVFCATTLAAGFAFLTISPIIGAAAGLFAFAILLYKRRNPAVQWNIEIRIEKNGIEEHFSALIDTGNRLREHRSALPVLIAERSAIPKLSALLGTLEENEIRRLGFGVLGSAGEMECFYPDRIRIIDSTGRILKAPDCWIGIFEGTIPGRTRALAPPEFAEYAFAGKSTAEEKIRRISHAIFNRQTIHLRPRCTDQARLSLLHRRQ